LFIRSRQKTKRFFTSPKTVILLIVITIIACLLGVLIPQVTDKSPLYFEAWREKSPYTFALVEFLQLNRVYTSFWFFILIALVLVTLGYSIYLLVKRNLRQDRGYSAQSTEVFRTGGETVDKIKRIFKKRRYRLTGRGEGETEGEQELVFAKNSIGRWGSVVFHSGIFIIIVSAIVTFSFQKRGFVQIMEGEVFSGRNSDFLVKDLGLFVKTFDAGFKTHLSRFRHTYWDTGAIKSLQSSVVVIKNNKDTEHNVSINSPLDINGVKVYQSSNYGYVLSFLFKESTGEEVMTRFLLDKPDRLGKPAIGRSAFPDTGYMLYMKFYPDITRPSFYPSKPILYLLDAEKGKEVFRGLLMPGQAVKIKKDILQFAAIRNWSGLIFARDIGTNIAYIGFVITIIGMIIMYFFPYKSIRLTMVGDSIISIKGITKRYHAIFGEEVNNIKAELGVGMDG